MTGLLIRAPEPRDVPALTAMTNLPGVRAGTLRLPYTGEEFVRRRLLDVQPGTHVVVGEVAGEAVAWATLIRGGGRRAHLGEVFLAVHDDHWGRGVGGAMLGALVDLADNWLGLLRLQLEVSAENPRARRLYERAGFEVEGRLRGDTLTDGALVDSLVMGRLRPAPRRAAEGSDAPSEGAR